MSGELLEMTLADVAALLRDRKVSPVELTTAALQRIAELNPRVNAFLTVTADLAQEQAKAAEAEIMGGEYRGPLHGVPLAVKDLYYTRGIRTTAGSKIMANFVPDFDAAVVEKLRDAGSVLLGKTALHEFAYGVTNDNPHYGPTRNPWDTTRTTGGSSGGSGAAVATGMAFSAMGTDTGGSIRIPASFCGVAGLKPTYGRVSVRGVYPLGYSLDHAGPLARTVEDVALVYDAIAGYDPQDDFSEDRPVREVRFKKSVVGLRVGVAENYFFDNVQPDVERAVRKALATLESAGARLLPTQLPDMVALTEASRICQTPEAYALHKKDLEDHPDDIGKDVKLLLSKGADFTAADYAEAQRARYRFRRQIELLFHYVDVIVMPATPLTAFPIGATKVKFTAKDGTTKEEDTRSAGTRFTRCFNATGHPVLSLCCGFDAGGLPIGLQIVGKMWDEACVLQAGYAYEQITDWHKKRPVVA